MDHQFIIDDIKKGNLAKIYFLHGEEPYFIDAITNAIVDNALQEHERDFNQTICYGKDSDVNNIMAFAREFPMMAERKLVIVREAQQLRNLEELEAYMANPTETTVLVIDYKYKNFDSRKKVLKEAAKNGIVFKSEKVPEYKLEAWINKYIQNKGYGITPKASILLSEFLGNDLSKIVNELEKLSLLVEKGTVINEIHIEENIGISKDYNMYELVNAIAERNFSKASTIVNYFDHNPKAASIVPVISNIFNHFERLMRIHFSENKSKEAIATSLRVHPFVAGKLLNSAKLYNPKKIAANIAVLHEFDLKSKGINNSSSSEGDLMKEMIYRLIH